MSKFIEELKRRNVIKASISYLVISWAVIQGADILFPVFDIPESSIKYLLYLLGILFPFWVVFAYIFEWTAQGFKKTDEVAPEVSEYKKTGKRLNAFIMGGLVIAVLLLVADRFLNFTGQMTPEELEAHNSIAILPFKNLSSDPEQEYFSDGISEEIINKLAQVQGLKVVGRTSSFIFKGQNQDLKTIGAQLGVSHVLEGSVMRSGNKLRITAQLINVSDGYQIYSEKFDRLLEDIFTVQDEISLAILDAIKIKLLGSDNEAILKKYTENVEAYGLFLKGRYHFNKLSPPDFLKAIDYYQAAIDIDPEYAIAYAEMSSCYQDAYFFNWLPREQSLPQAIAAADKALQLDDQIAESHIAMGRIKLWIAWDFEEAFSELEKGNSINPNNIEGLRQLAVYYMLMGDYAEGNKYIWKAENLDPFSFLNIVYLAGYHQWDGDFEKVIEYGNKLIAMAPNFFGGYFLLGAGNLGKKQYEKSVTSLESAARMNGDILALSYLGMACGYNGEEAKAREVLEKMNELVGEQNLSNAYFGNVYGALGEWDRAFDYFDKAVTNKEGQMLYFQAFIRDYFHEINQDPRTRALIERIGLPLD